MLANVPATFPLPKRRPWQTGIAPIFIGLFFWVGYYDGMARSTLSIGGLGWSALGAATGGLLCYILLYYAPAMWGLRTGKTFTELAESTFGRRGAGYIPGLVIAVAQVAWFSVATHYAIEYTLRGLAAIHALDPSHLAPWRLGKVTLRGPLFLATALVWSCAFALVGRYAVRLVSAIMKVYPYYAAAVLACGMLWALPGLRGFQPLDFDPATLQPVRDGRLLAFAAMIQYVFGFFATAGPSAADWGAVSQKDEDIRLGGMVGVFGSATILAILPLITIAGALGREPTPPGLAVEVEAQASLSRSRVAHSPSREDIHARREVRAVRADTFTYGAILQRGLSGVPGAAMLFILALGSMGPAVYAAHVAGGRLEILNSKFSRTRWCLCAAALAYPLLVFGVPARPERFFDILGALVAPVMGAVLAEYALNRGHWPGPRSGVNRAGVAAWAVGLVVGLIPSLGLFLRWPAAINFRPAAVAALCAAAMVYFILATLRLQPPVEAPSEPTATDDSI
jgi:cytosine permease